VLSDVQEAMAGGAGKDDVPAGPGSVTVRLPGCRPKNPLNGAQGRSRGAALGKARARKALRELAAWSTRAALPSVRRLGQGKLRIVLERVAPRPYDSDGWAAASKPIRDGIADALGSTDADSVITWQYTQTRGGVREYAVRIHIALETPQ
jgi:hypothetical protein